MILSFFTKPGRSVILAWLVAAFALLSASCGRAAAAGWSAQWIWLKPDTGIHAATFSKTVTLSDIPSEAFLQITADDAYLLAVNGHTIGQDGDWRVARSYDVAKWLRAGGNEITVQVQNGDGPAGLLLEGHWKLAGGEQMDIKTDESWWVSAGKNAVEVAVLGQPPVGPWGAIAYSDPGALRPVQIKSVEAPSGVTAGTNWRGQIHLTAPLAEAERSELQVGFQKNGQEVPLTGSVVRPAVSADGLTIFLDVPVSRWAAGGAYTWRVTGSALQLAVPAKNAVLAVTAAVLPPPAGFRWPHRPSNVMKVGGQEQAPYMYNTARRDVASYRNWSTRTGLHLYETSLLLSSSWRSEDVLDVSELETNLLKILEADPQAQINVFLRLDIPAWWRLLHPNDVCILSGGQAIARQSFFSLQWRQDCQTAMKMLRQKLAEMPAGRCVGGVTLGGGDGGEMMLTGQTTAQYDVSPAANEAFRRWCAEQHTPAVSLPSPALARPFPMDESSKEIRRRFFHFVADWQGDNLVVLSRAARSIFGPDFQISVYYGYIMELAGYRPVSGPRVLFSGHLGLQRVLDQGSFDCLMSICTYALRQPGQAGSYMAPVDSIVLHNIAHLNENDIRTHLVTKPDSSGRPAANLEVTKELFRREMFVAAQKGTTMRFNALLADVDQVQDPAILDYIGTLSREARALHPLPLGQEDEIAYVLDPEALYGITSLPNWETLPPLFISQARDTLARMDRPVAWLLYDDWVKNKDKFHTVVVPLPSLLSPEHKAVIENWCGAAMPPMDEKTGAVMAERGRDPHMAAFTDLDALAKALNMGVGGSKTPVRFIGENFRVDYGGGQFTTNANALR